MNRAIIAALAVLVLGLAAALATTEGKRAEAERRAGIAYAIAQSATTGTHREYECLQKGGVYFPAGFYRVEDSTRRVFYCATTFNTIPLEVDR